MITIIKKLFFILVCSIVLFTLLGCPPPTIDEPEHEEPTPEPTEPIINDDVIVIEPTILTLISNSTELSQGIYHYQYSGNPIDFNSNSIIVGQQGYGYMRKVNNVIQSGNEIILETEQARLTDVIAQCDIQESIKLSINNKKAYFNEKSVNMRVVYLAEGVSIKSLKGGETSIDLSNTELFSGNIGGTNLTARITNGSISFEPTFNREFKFSLISPHIRKLSLSAVGSLNFDCDLQLVSSGPISYGNEIPIVPIGVFEFGPFMIGPVPMFVGLSFYAGFETVLNLSGTFETGFDVNASVEFGAKYYQSQWSTIWEKSASFNQHPITWSYDGNVFARAYVAPRVSVTIAGVVGPYLEVEPYLEFDGDIQINNWQWELVGGLDGNLGFSVSILGYDLADFNTTLLNWEIPIAGDNGTIGGNSPLADFTANTTSITEGGTVNFNDLSTNSPTSWLWNFGDGGTSTLQNPSNTYSTAGTYIVSLTATNAYGSDTETKYDYINVNSIIELKNDDGTCERTLSWIIGDYSEMPYLLEDQGGGFAIHAWYGGEIVTNPVQDNKYGFAVSLTPSSYPFYLQKVKIYFNEINSVEQGYYLHVWDESNNNLIPTTYLIPAGEVLTPGWWEKDISEYNISVDSGIIKIGICQRYLLNFPIPITFPPPPRPVDLGGDTSSVGNSEIIVSGGFQDFSDMNFMIRAEGF